MTEPLVRVEFYSGYKAEERPARLVFESQTLEIIEVEDRWYSPGETYFRVRAENGERYVLCRQEGQDAWSVTAFRAPQEPAKTKIN